MKLTKAGLVVIVTIVILSAFVANIAQLISTDTVRVEITDNKNIGKDILIGDSSDNLLWFVQVSDLHLSIFQDRERIIELRDFCENTLKIIKPNVVLATGDLTDAKDKDNVGSTQFEAEWKIYNDILQSCSILKKTPWLDIRGNHDNFDVPGLNSDRNYFRKYSIQGKNHPRSYLHKINKSNRTYSFIGVDACPDQGLKRPFNFIGLIQHEEIDELKRLMESAKNSDSIIWFGHYPTSCILSHPPGIRSLIGSQKGSLAYLCGHFHSLLGLVPKMYTIQKQGFYELELADWKDNRMFRVAVIDHGILSFVDVKYNDWPIILISNPKNMQFQLFSKEPIDSIISSTHIRILVFSPSTVLSVQVKIDKNEWENCVEAPTKHLFLLKWNGIKYAKGIHSIQVSVLDESGRQKTIKQEFSLDGNTFPFGIMSRLILMLDFGSTLQFLFGFATICSVLPLCILRYMSKNITDPKNSFLGLKNGMMKNCLRRLWILSRLDRLFFPIVFYPLYLSIGPWAVGELINGYIGVIFIWGIFVNGSYIPGTFTYGYGFIQLFLFQGPLVVFTSYAVDNRLFGKRLVMRNKLVKYALTLMHCTPFLIIFFSQVTMTYMFWLSYGTMSTLLGPVRLWPLALTVWAWFNANAMPLSKIRNAAAVWTKVSDSHCCSQFASSTAS